MACNCSNRGASQVSEINTQSSACGSTPNCIPDVAAPSAVPCGCDTCGCQSAIINPIPFYNQVPECQEDHTTVLVNQNFVTTVSTAASFNMPACNGQITIVIPGLQSVQVGAYLWNATYGYLKIISFDYVTCQLVVENECQVSNAAPGTEIPGCTLFNVVDPPFEAPDECGEGIWVTADFVTPVLGASVDVSVNTVAGLLLNRDVQVGTGIFLLTAFVTPNTIRLKNNGGAGLVPGTTIYAKDANGNCVSPIAVYQEDICAAVPNTPGSLVICDQNGNLTTLEATVLNQIPVCTDVSANEFTAQTVDLPIILCTAIDACLTLISGTDVYTVVVLDSSLFVEGDVVFIQDPRCDTVYWTITDIVDGTHIEITAIVPNTLDIACIDAGIGFCHAPCCVQNAHDIVVLEGKLNAICDLDWSSAQLVVNDASGEPDEAGATVSPTQAWDSTTRSLSISNPTCNTLKCVVSLDYFIQGTYNTNQDSWARAVLVPYFGYSSAALPGPAPVPALPFIRSLAEDLNFGTGTKCHAYDAPYYASFHREYAVNIAPNTIARFDAKQQFQNLYYSAGSNACCSCGSLVNEGSGIFTITASSVYIHVIGAAVQAA